MTGAVISTPPARQFYKADVYGLTHFEAVYAHSVDDIAVPASGSELCVAPDHTTCPTATMAVGCDAVLLSFVR